MPAPPPVPPHPRDRTDCGTLGQKCHGRSQCHSKGTRRNLVEPLAGERSVCGFLTVWLSKSQRASVAHCSVHSVTAKLPFSLQPLLQSPSQHSRLEELNDRENLASQEAQRRGSCRTAYFTAAQSKLPFFLLLSSAYEPGLRPVLLTLARWQLKAQGFHHDPAMFCVSLLSARKPFPGSSRHIVSHTSLVRIGSHAQS